MEVMFTLLLVAILLGLTGVTLRSSVDKEGSRGLAYTLASDLRAARTEALRSGRYVAVCFPSEGKTNSASRSAILRKGQQRGHIGRILSYGNEYEAVIFLGQWPGTVTSNHKLPDSWPVSTSNEIAIMFAPDGSAFSNDLPALEGSYPIVVATSFQGDLSGPTGTLTAALNPHTVWVSSAGSISVDEKQVPVGSLPVGRSEVAVAELDLSKEPSPKSPVVEEVKFYPEPTAGLDTAYIGQNFVSIHPNQKEGSYLEYGLATIDLRVTDADGGPLTYTLEAKASGPSSGTGDFTVSNHNGQMQYIFDEERNQYLWHALISWRPPPKSPSDFVYQLSVTVHDPEGNSVLIDSGAGLLPKITSLPPSRMVVCTTGKQLHLANLDGKNEIHLSKNGGEYRPFFSADGSRLYSLHDLPSSSLRQVRSRPADGSSTFQVLASYAQVDGESWLQLDPTSILAAINTDLGIVNYPIQIPVHPTETSGSGDNETTNHHVGCHFQPSTEGIHTYKIDVVNLMTNEKLAVTSRASSNGVEWAENIKHNFAYNLITQRNEFVETVGGCGISGMSFVAGYDSPQVFKKVEGYPSQLRPGDPFSNSSQGRSYNPTNPDWYVQVNGNSLHLGNRNSGSSFNPPVSIYTASGPIENEPHNNEARLAPTWSADGQWVSFVVNPRTANSTVIALKVLNSSYSPIGGYSPTFTHSAANLSSAQLAPDGRWVYFLNRGNNQIYRADNNSGGAPVNISSHFAGGVSSYVLSP